MKVFFCFQKVSKSCASVAETETMLKFPRDVQVLVTCGVRASIHNLDAGILNDLGE